MYFIVILIILLLPYQATSLLIILIKNMRTDLHSPLYENIYATCLGQARTLT